MPRQRIPAYRNIPESFDPSSYSIKAPVGVWRAQLVMLAWGQKANLFCFFDLIGDPGRYCLPVYWKTNPEAAYRPAGGGDPMDHQPLGREFEIETRLNTNGNVQLYRAVPVT